MIFDCSIDMNLKKTGVLVYIFSTNSNFSELCNSTLL